MARLSSTLPSSTVARSAPVAGNASLTHRTFGQTCIRGSKKPYVRPNSRCQRCGASVQHVTTPPASRSCIRTACRRGSMPLNVLPPMIPATRIRPFEGRNRPLVTMSGAGAQQSGSSASTSPSPSSSAQLRQSASVARGAVVDVDVGTGGVVSVDVLVVVTTGVVTVVSVVVGTVAVVVVGTVVVVVVGGVTSVVVLAMLWASAVRSVEVA